MLPSIRPALAAMKKVKVSMGGDHRVLLVPPTENVAMMAALCKHEFGVEEDVQLFAFVEQGFSHINASHKLQRVLAADQPHLVVSTHSLHDSPTAVAKKVAVPKLDASKQIKVKLAMEDDMRCLFLPSDVDQSALSRVLREEFGTDVLELFVDDSIVSSLKELHGLFKACLKKQAECVALARARRLTTSRGDGAGSVKVACRRCGGRPMWLRYQNQATVAVAPTLGRRQFDGPLPFSAFKDVVHMSLPIEGSDTVKIDDDYARRFPLHTLVKHGECPLHVSPDGAGDCRALRAHLFDEVLGRRRIVAHSSETPVKHSPDLKLREHLNKKDPVRGADWTMLANAPRLAGPPSTLQRRQGNCIASRRCCTRVLTQTSLRSRLAVGGVALGLPPRAAEG